MANPSSKTTALHLAIVGAETLLGRELEEVLTHRIVQASITPYSASGEGTFEEEAGEAIYRKSLEAGSLKNDAFVLFAGTIAGAQKTYEVVKNAGGRPVLVDCTGELDSQPEARIVAPLLEDTGSQPAIPKSKSNWLLVIAHPAASALALTLSRAARYLPIRRSIMNVFEPASERGKRGAAELHQQTSSLLSFKTLDKDVYDAQLGFSLLPSYGEQAPFKLITAEQRIERHLATLLSRRTGEQAIEMPSLRLIQVPAFHGYSVSAWIEFESNVDSGGLSEALASAQIEVRGTELDAPTNVGATGESGLIAGDIRVDANNPRAAWLWLVADNLRLTADAAVDIVTRLKHKA